MAGRTAPPLLGPNGKGLCQFIRGKIRTDIGRSGTTTLGGGFGTADASYASCRGFNSLPLHFSAVTQKESTMTKKQSQRNETTGTKAASNAGKVLSNPKSSKEAKSAAASALTQVV